MDTSKELASSPNPDTEDNPITVRAARRPTASRTVKLRVGAAMTTGAAVVGLVAACGGSDNSTAYLPPAPATSSAPGGSTSAAGTMVTVTETEFEIQLSQHTFTPGTYTFVVDNSGQATHALEIEGPGLSGAETSHLSPGDSNNLTVTLRSGTYKLYCPVGNHEAMGMSLDITVT